MPGRLAHTARRRRRDDADRLGSAALERFYRDHAQAVHAYLTSLCRDRHWAEDLMQDTFVRATRALPAYRGGSPRAWLFAIARTTFLDAARRAQRVTVADPAEQSFADPDIAERHAIASALLRLSEEQRSAIVLHDQVGLTHAEVGAILGKTPGATRVLLHRARTAFRTAYERQDS